MSGKVQVLAALNLGGAKCDLVVDSGIVLDRIQTADFQRAGALRGQLGRHIKKVLTADREGTVMSAGTRMFTPAFFTRAYGPAIVRGVHLMTSDIDIWMHENGEQPLNTLEWEALLMSMFPVVRPGDKTAIKPFVQPYVRIALFQKALRQHAEWFRNHMVVDYARKHGPLLFPREGGSFNFFAPINDMRALVLDMSGRHVLVRAYDMLTEREGEGHVHYVGGSALLAWQVDVLAMPSREDQRSLGAFPDRLWTEVNASLKLMRAAEAHRIWCELWDKDMVALSAKLQCTPWKAEGTEEAAEIRDKRNSMDQHFRYLRKRSLLRPGILGAWDRGNMPNPDDSGWAVDLYKEEMEAYDSFCDSQPKDGQFAYLPVDLGIAEPAGTEKFHGYYADFTSIAAEASSQEFIRLPGIISPQRVTSTRQIDDTSSSSVDVTIDGGRTIRVARDWYINNQFIGMSPAVYDTTATERRAACLEDLSFREGNWSFGMSREDVPCRFSHSN